MPAGMTVTPHPGIGTNAVTGRPFPGPRLVDRESPGGTVTPKRRDGTSRYRRWP